jgi:hypothetical protein
VSELVVTARHLFTIPHFSTRPGFCRSGARAWFDAHGLDWRAFLRDGIPAADLEATEDALALALVDWARRVESGRAA